MAGFHLSLLKNGKEWPESEFRDVYPSGRQWKEMADIFSQNLEIMLAYVTAEK